MSESSKMLAQYVSLTDIERKAIDILPKSVRDYYASGADEELTLDRNTSAYRKLLIRPRVLHDVKQLDNTVRLNIPGNEDKLFPYPIGIAPTAFHCMAHPEGELATCRAAGETNTLMICSSLSTTRMEDVMKNAPSGTHLWYQLYVYKDKRITENLVKRAIASGFKAIVFTVDAPMMGRRRADERNGFELPAHLRMANFDVETLESRTLEAKTGVSGFGKYSSELMESALTWDMLKWLIDYSTIPVLVKGVMRADDAIKCLEAGAKGIIVSNHGGRQLDSAPSTIEALPEVVNAVRGRCPVFVDGGIRTGTDIFKAIALGADMVFIGRPIIYGLAVSGSEGIKHVLKLLRIEFEYAMRLAGVSTIKDIRSNNMVVHENFYAKL
uniref:(S)-2-hydroxy-acid oxidase n=1 Tax=Acrobeloides nanus TaxID=290746 RepID=A0A914BYJ4_9BILA